MKFASTPLFLMMVGLIVALTVAVSTSIGAEPAPTPGASVSSPTPPPAAAPSPAAQSPQPAYVGSETCLGCHDKIEKAFNKTPHRKILKADSGHESWKGCESCHGPGSEHVEAGGGPKGIQTWKQPLRLTGKEAQEANRTCLSCHQDNNHLATWNASAHNASTVACISCHDPHRSDHPRLLRQPWQPDPVAVRADAPPSAPRDFGMEPSELCLQCHKSYRAQAMMPSHHPLLEGKMACTSCHDVHSLTNNAIRGITVNELCAKCHREKTGPFAFEHAPSTDSCASCHRVHGSVNDNLLTVPEPTLCLKCHRSPHVGWSVQTSPNARLGRNMAYTRCSNCHQAHGSDQSIYLLY